MASREDWSRRTGPTSGVLVVSSGAGSMPPKNKNGGGGAKNEIETDRCATN